MKPGSFLKTLACVALLLSPRLTPAAGVTLTASDASGSSSFNAAGNWSNGAAPNTNNDYSTATFALRTPADNKNYVFGGNSLTLQPGTSSGYSLIYQGTAANNIYTITNFTSAGGLIHSSAGSGNTCTLAGNLLIAPAGGTIEADQSPFVISANLSGSGILTNLNPLNKTFGKVTYSGTNSAFTGELLLGTQSIVIFTNVYSTPGNPSVANPGQITLLAGSTLLDDVGVSLNNANGGLTLQGSATINVAVTNAGTATTVYEPITDNGLGYSLTKSGLGTLILGNDNSYAGTTVISNGVLQVGNGGDTGSVGAGPVTNNASLIFNQAFAEMVTNDISGTGTLTLAGGADLFLTGSNHYSGQTFIIAGTLHPENGSALGLGTAAFVNTNGGNLDVDLNLNFPTLPLILGGYTTALEKGGAGVSTLGGTVTLASDATLYVDTGATLNLTNAAGINGTKADANLTLAGDGTGNVTGPISLGAGSLTVNGSTWTLAASNNFSGGTTINGGTLLISGALSLSQPPSSFNAGQLTLNGGALGVVTNVTLADGNLGITLNANATFSVINTNTTFTISNDITGGSTLIKSGPGRLVLDGANDFGGTLNVDTGSTNANDGTTVIANHNAIADLPVGDGSSSIVVGNSVDGSSTFALDGTLGPITVAPDISLAGRNGAVPALENLVGSNTLSGHLTLQPGGALYEIQSDAGILTLSAPLPYATLTTNGCTLTFLGAGNLAVTGAIQDGTNNDNATVSDSVVADGPGWLTLAATNTYSSSTIVSNGVLDLTGRLGTGPVTIAGGLLVGTGTLLGPVTVQSAGSIEAGTTSTIGTLNCSNTLALAGNTIVKINPTGGAHDLFNGATSVAYGGSLTVSNLGGTPAPGAQFKLFSAATASGGFINLAGSPGAGLAYRFNATNGVLSVVSTVAPQPAVTGVNLSGTNLVINGTNGVAGEQYNVLTTTNLALPLNAWTVLPTNVFTSGTFSITNPVNPNAPQAFYLIRLP